MKHCLQTLFFAVGIAAVAGQNLFESFDGGAKIPLDSSEVSLTGEVGSAHASSMGACPPQWPFPAHNNPQYCCSQSNLDFCGGNQCCDIGWCQEGMCCPCQSCKSKTMCCPGTYPNCETCSMLNGGSSQGCCTQQNLCIDNDAKNGLCGTTIQSETGKLPTCCDNVQNLCDLSLPKAPTCGPPMTPLPPIPPDIASFFQDVDCMTHFDSKNCMTLTGTDCASHSHSFAAKKANCLQAITKAKQSAPFFPNAGPDLGILTFPTSCLPNGWEITEESCTSAQTPLVIFHPINSPQSKQTCGGCYKDLFAGRYIYCDNSNSNSLKHNCDWYGNNCTFPPIKSVTQAQCEELCLQESGCQYLTYYASISVCNLHLVMTCQFVSTKAEGQIFQKMLPPATTSVTQQSSLANRTLELVTQGILYRVLRYDEITAAKVFPKDPTATYTISAHIANGNRYNTQYISASQNLAQNEAYLLATSDIRRNVLVVLQVETLIAGGCQVWEPMHGEGIKDRDFRAKQFAISQQEVIISSTTAINAEEYRYAACATEVLTNAVIRETIYVDRE